jgi:hypothetical protein
MLSFALATILAFVATDPPVELRYTIERVDAATVAVTVTTPVDRDGSTEWLLPPDWAGSPDPRLTIAEATAERTSPPGVTNDAASGADRRLSVEPVRGANGASDGADPDPTLWRVRATTGSMTLRYLLRSAGPKSEGRVGNDYGTIVREDLFRLHGPLGLVIPSSAGSDEPIRATLVWKGFGGPGMAAVSSLGRGDASVITTPAELQNGLFMAGAIAIGEQPVPGGVLRVAVHGAWSFAAEELAAFVAPIVRAEREFFADTTEPQFLVTLQSNGVSPSSGGFSLGGTACTNAFALYCMPSLTIGPGSPHALEVKKLLAHEYFHTWNGHVLGTSGVEGSAYWFSEGFTDHFARRILRAAGLITDAEFVEILNSQTGRYVDNGHRAAPNAIIVDRFWNDREASELPYLRGDLLATVINEEIVRTSGGARSIDDLIRSLVTRARTERWRPDTEALLTAITEVTSPEFGAWLRAAVLDGIPIELPRGLSNPLPLALTEARMRTFDIGFDFEASRTTMVITGVRPGTGAEAAGLRDGMKLVSASIGPGDGKGPPLGVVTVRDGEATKEIRYEALSPPKTVAAYVLRPAATAAPAAGPASAP